MLSRAIDRTTGFQSQRCQVPVPEPRASVSPGVKGDYGLHSARSVAVRTEWEKVDEAPGSGTFRPPGSARLAPEARTKACGCEESPHPSPTSSRAPPLGKGSPRYDLLLAGSSGSCCLRAHTWATLFHDGTQDPASHSVTLLLPLPPPRSSRVPAHVRRPSPSAACPLVPSRGSRPPRGRRTWCPDRTVSALRRAACGVSASSHRACTVQPWMAEEGAELFSRARPASSLRSGLSEPASYTPRLLPAEEPAVWKVIFPPVFETHPVSSLVLEGTVHVECSRLLSVTPSSPHDCRSQ